AGRVWVLDGDKVKPITVTLGISDGSATEILRGDLKEGQDVAIGLAGAKGTTTGGGAPRLRL
ncbi:MAG TPA: efflux RND transporter periplasmic adaptor subunit, partial [Methylomirabilota bacterium]|nr:efflux RND transporter periplasmic adaptor subunit [Methylomirabilota bacterium]